MHIQELSISSRNKMDSVCASMWCNLSLSGHLCAIIYGAINDQFISHLFLLSINIMWVNQRTKSNILFNRNQTPSQKGASVLLIHYFYRKVYDICIFEWTDSRQSSKQHKKNWLGLYDAWLLWSNLKCPTWIKGQFHTDMLVLWQLCRSVDNIQSILFPNFQLFLPNTYSCVSCYKYTQELHWEDPLVHEGLK